jgi:predicted transcriptional regulator
MAEQLTSVRFDTETLASLRAIAEVNDSNVAAEVRKAVAEYVERTINDPQFEEKAQASVVARRDRVARLLSANRQ